MKNLISVFTLISLVLLIGCSDSNYYKVESCFVEKDEAGQILTCGADTIEIPDQMPILEIVDPCGDGPGVDEVVIILEGGLYLAWYKNVGLAVLEEITQYKTTDAQKCRFKIVNGVLEEI